MNRERAPVGTWRELAERWRDTNFVGRARDLALFDAFLLDESRRLLHVHGPGGVGKSTFIRQCASRTRARGLEVRVLDARAFARTPSSLHETIASPVSLLVIDEIQALASFWPWLREEVIPELSSSTRVLLASRDSLGAEWWATSHLSGLVQSHGLEPLSREDAAALLEKRGVPFELWPRIMRMAHGLPLALVLAADEAASGMLSGVNFGGVESLLEHLSSPRGEGSALRNIVELAAINPVVTQELVAEVLSDQPTEAAHFKRFLQRSDVDPVEGGGRLHDVVRELVSHHLRSSREEHRRALVDRSIEHHARVCAGRSNSSPEFVRSLRCAIDITERELAMLVGARGEAVHADALARDDLPIVLECVERSMGREQRRWAERYAREVPEGCVIGRGEDGRPKAWMCFLELPMTSVEDPALALMAEVQRDRRGVSGIFARFYVPLSPSREVESFLMSELTYRLVCSSRFSLAASFQPREIYDGHPEYAFHEFFGEFQSDERLFCVTGHDLRTDRFGKSVESIAKSRLAHVRASFGEGEPDRPKLDRAQFRRELKVTLRSLHNTRTLMSSPLVGVFSPRGGEAGARRLREVIEAACASFGDRGEDALLRDVLMATYVDMPKKQLAAAAELGMGYSTLRKRLAEAVVRLEAILWEVAHGRPPRA